MERIPDEEVSRLVIQDLRNRVVHGFQKYGVTLDRNDLTLREWLQHAYEESLDFCKYLRRAMIEIDKHSKLLNHNELVGLNNLLAVIHHDGGHYTQRHGYEKSITDAEKNIIQERNDDCERGKSGRT